MSYPLDGCAAKIKRAEQHLEAINDAVQAFLHGRPYRTETESDTETGENIIRIRVDREPPTSLSALIGDCLYNLRSCLDHLAWQLVLVNGETPDTRTEFPIFKDSTRYLSGAAKKIRGIAPAQQTIIESLQPYHAADPEGEPLWILQELSNIDKHRVLHLVGGTIQEVSHVLLTRGAAILNSEGPEMGPFEDGAVVGRFTLESPDAKVDMHFGLAFAVHFEPGGPARGEQVVRTLGVLGEAVTDTVNRFRPPLR